MATSPSDPSALESALTNVRGILADLLVAADEQLAAFAAGDVERVARVTRTQEVLSARLERAERERLIASGEASLREIAATLSPSGGAGLMAMAETIAQAVRELHERNERNVLLLTRGAELATQTVQFLQRLVSEHIQPYGADGAPVVGQSLLLDGRA